MEYIKEQSLRDFEFWGGATDRVKLLTLEELDKIEDELLFQEVFSSTPTEVEINDLFWHDFNFVCELIGLTEEEVFKREDEE